MNNKHVLNNLICSRQIHPTSTDDAVLFGRNYFMLIDSVIIFYGLKKQNSG